MNERLSALFETHAGRLYRLARRLAPSAEDARDLVQETFVRAATSFRRIPTGSEQEEAWLVRVLINVRRDQWRREAVRRRHRNQVHHTIPVNRDDPESSLLIRTTVWRALDRLAPRRRAVIVMHELEGLAVPSIAALLGISAITVRWHLSRGRLELARELKCELGETHEQQSENTLAGRRPAPSRRAAP